MQIKKTILLILLIVSSICAHAAERGRWFIAPTYGLSFVEGAVEFFDDDLHVFDTQVFSRYGVMGGYLGNWGGYARINFAESNISPNITLGATKRLFTFGDTAKSRLHCNLGLGYGSVYSVLHSKIVEIENNSNPDGPLYKEVSGPREVSHQGSGWSFEGGLIYNHSHLNVGLTYAINVNFLLPSFDPEPGSKPNQTLFLSVGYTF